VVDVAGIPAAAGFPAISTADKLDTALSNDARQWPFRQSAHYWPPELEPWYHTSGKVDIDDKQRGWSAHHRFK
jgi:hypothetical protein